MGPGNHYQKERLVKPTVKASLARNVSSKSGRTDYVRVKFNHTAGGLQAIPLFGRSGMLRPLTEADGLLTIPADKEGLMSGESVEIEIWN